MQKNQRLIRQFTFLGFFLVVLFAGKTFQNAVPDQIYVKMGEKLTYDFDVPVRMVLNEESKEVFENTIKGIDGETMPSYMVTCKLFGIFPVKEIEVVMIEPKSVYAGGMPIGIYVKTRGVLIVGTGEVDSRADGLVKPAENLSLIHI